MPLTNTSKIPPGGWRYVETKTGYKLNSMSGFHEACKELANHRRSNNLPRASLNETAEDIDTATCQRLGYDPNWCSQTQKKTAGFPSQGREAEGVLHVVQQSISNTKTGSQILMDWLGEGGIPVSQELAQARASVCVNECSDPQRQFHCFNLPPQYFQRVAAKVAQAILEQRREKTNLGLTVDGEDKLHTCQICECHLPLKVWVPMDIILGRTKPEVMEKFPDYCWMRTENRRNNQSLETTATKTTDNE